MNNICMVCGELSVDDSQTIRLVDDKSNYEIIGHIKCTDDVYKKIKGIKDLSKKPVKKVLIEIGFNER